MGYLKYHGRVQKRKMHSSGSRSSQLSVIIILRIVA
jgi:hypothetical protein